jgi:hypothetical protein
VSLCPELCALCSLCPLLSVLFVPCSLFCVLSVLGALCLTAPLLSLPSHSCTLGEAARAAGFERGATVKSSRKEVHSIVHPLCKNQYNRVYGGSEAGSVLNRTAREEDIHPQCPGVEESSGGNISVSGDSESDLSGGEGSDRKEEGSEEEGAEREGTDGEGTEGEGTKGEGTKGEDTQEQSKTASKAAKKKAEQRTTRAPRVSTRKKPTPNKKAAKAPTTRSAKPESDKRAAIPLAAIPLEDGAKGVVGQLYLCHCSRECKWPGVLHAEPPPPAHSSPLPFLSLSCR